MRTCITAVLMLGFAPAAPSKDSCVECHGALTAGLQAPALSFNEDVHHHAGFSCAACHGGDPQSDDPETAMSRARGFAGRISRTAVPQLCARCHSDANLIHRFRPQQRVDQMALYQTSVHGKRLATGDTAVANCVDCHSVHNIRNVKDPRSPVHPLRLPETCARCHADRNHMAKYKIATNQFEEYRTSVHWEALAKRQDLSAPSCAACHGNHGATPPQVSSVAAVCGTCHALFEELYNGSPHKAAFSAMGVAGCVTCHGNHAVRKPGDGMLAGDGSVCAGCHDAQSPGGKTAAVMFRQIHALETSLERSEEVVGRARRSGMEVSEAALRLQEGKDALVKARVAVHGFREPTVATPVGEGLRIAAETFQAGQSALRERDFRRMGLGISLLAILLTIAGLWLAIRQLEGKQHADPQTSGR